MTCLLSTGDGEVPQRFIRWCDKRIWENLLATKLVSPTLNPPDRKNVKRKQKADRLDRSPQVGNHNRHCGRKTRHPETETSRGRRAFSVRIHAAAIF